MEWMLSASESTIAAHQAFESFIRRKSRNVKQGASSIHEDVTAASENSSAPSVQQIEEAWKAYESTAHFILQARRGSKAKPHRRALQAALSMTPAPDQLSFLHSAVVTRATHPENWQLMLQLVPNETPYSNRGELASHIHTYLQLLALLPDELLDHVTPETCLEIVRRDSHNSFGIRSLDDGGDEFFGFGVWPEASFFNHSCSPNLGKKRVARSWEFWTVADVEEGTELTISYLGGDEETLDVAERRRRLEAVWDFRCECRKCAADAVEAAAAKSENGTEI